jgi:hypothetical protein
LDGGIPILSGKRLPNRLRAGSSLSTFPTIGKPRHEQRLQS